MKNNEKRKKNVRLEKSFEMVQKDKNTIMIYLWVRNSDREGLASLLLQQRLHLPVHAASEDWELRPLL